MTARSPLALLALCCALIPTTARALTFESSAHTLTSSACAIRCVSEKLPGTDLTQFDDSLSTSEDSPGFDYGENDATLSYDVGPSQITTSHGSFSYGQGDDGSGSGSSSLTIVFTVESTVDYILDGAFRTNGDNDFDSQSYWQMLTRLEDGIGGIVFERNVTGPEADLYSVGTLPPDTYTLFVSNRGGAYGSAYKYQSAQLGARADLTLTLAPEPRAPTLQLASAIVLAGLARRRWSPGRAHPPVRGWRKPVAALSYYQGYSQLSGRRMGAAGLSTLRLCQR